MNEAAASAGLNRSPGQFWGIPTRRREAGGITFGLLAATEAELEPHVHEESHLIFVFAGNYISSADGAPPVASTPILCNNPAGTAHRDQFLGPGGRFLAISLPLHLAREGPARASQSPAYIRAMARLIAEMDETDSPLPLGEFAALLSANAPQAVPPAGEEAVPAWLDTSYEAVMDERPGSLTVQRLADAAGVHPVHLTRCFRRHFGRTPGELLRARQFERGCRRLTEGRDPIAAIAHDLGYCDQAHFTRAFARHAGCTPGRWRAAHV